MNVLRLKIRASGLIIFYQVRLDPEGGEAELAAVERNWPV